MNRNDPRDDERTHDDPAVRRASKGIEAVLRDANAPGAPPIDPVRARLGPNFTPTPFGYEVEEVVLGDDGEQAVMVVLFTVMGQVAVVMRPGEAAEWGRALLRYGGGLTIVEP